MFEQMVKYLHQKDKSVLLSVIYNQNSTSLDKYISNDSNCLRRALQIDENIFIENNLNTTIRINILRKIFILFNEDPADLIFYLKDVNNKLTIDGDLKKRYWEYALPMIIKQHSYRGTFSNSTPTETTYKSGFIGISGFCVNCVADSTDVRVEFYMGSSDSKKNKDMFDQVYKHKNDIEKELGVSLNWDRKDDNKASTISYRLSNVSINNEEDWPTIANFHTEWSDKLCSIILEHILTEEELRNNEIIKIIRNWLQQKSGVNMDLLRCNKSHTRFTTDKMSEILPDSKEELSGWKTYNNYFYEIVLKDNKYVHFQFALNSTNATDEFMKICDEINVHVPVKILKDDWTWRTHFKSSRVKINEILNLDEIEKQLEICFKEIMSFENELVSKVGK